MSDFYFCFIRILSVLFFTYFFTQRHISFQFMSYLITVLCLGLLQNLVLRFLLFYVHLRLLFQFYNLLTIQAERQVLKLKDGWWIRTTFIRFIASNVHLLNNFTYNHSVPTHTRICHAQQISFRCCHPPYFYLQLFVSWVSCQPNKRKLWKTLYLN